MADFPTPARSRAPGQFWGVPTRRREARGVVFEIRAATDKKLEPHVHEESHFIFVFAGNYVSSARGAPSVASTPILFDNPAGTCHRDQFLGPGGRFLAVSLPRDRAREGVASASRNLSDLLAMNRLIAELDEQDSPLPLGEFALLFEDRERASNADDTTIPAWLARAYETVMDEHPERLTVERLASEAGVHPVHLTRSFRRHFRRTAGQLLRARQFERACQSLSDPRRRIADIAHDLGYFDQAHFTRAFSRRTGCTPGAWRAAEVANLQDRPACSS